VAPTSAVSAIAGLNFFDACWWIGFGAKRLGGARCSTHPTVSSADVANAESTDVLLKVCDMLTAEVAADSRDDLSCRQGTTGLTGTPNCAGLLRSRSAEALVVKAQRTSDGRIRNRELA
jgi:hypothetical protein